MSDIDKMVRQVTGLLDEAAKLTGAGADNWAPAAKLLFDAISAAWAHLAASAGLSLAAVDDTLAAMRARVVDCKEMIRARAPKPPAPDRSNRGRAS